MNWKTERKSWNSSTCYSSTSFTDLCCARFSNVPTSDEGGPPTSHLPPPRRPNVPTYTFSMLTLLGSIQEHKRRHFNKRVDNTLQ